MRITWVYPAANLSGGTKSNRLIAEAMVRRGHEVNLAYPDVTHPWPPPWRIRRFGRRLHAEVVALGREKHHLTSSTVNLIRVPHRPIRHEDVPDADVVIATWWETREWIEEWPDAKGMKAYFVRGHEVFSKHPDRIAATYRMPGVKLVISRWLQRVMAEEYGDPNAVLVPNGVDWSQFDSTPRGRNATPTVGMLYGRGALKGPDTALKALRLVQQQIPSLRVVAFGSQPMLREHRALAPSGLELHVRPTQTMIPELYKRADCWVVPSTTEGFGMPGLEAAACHCPVVSTRCGGPEDYVDDGVSGHLVPVGDPHAMADAILSVLSLDNAAWRTMSEASYQMSQRFDWDRSAEILEEALLQRLQSKHGQTSASATAAS